MNKFFLLATILPALFLFSCANNDSPKATVAEKQAVAVPSGTTYSVDTLYSMINWKATHRAGLSPRWGIVRIKEGSIYIDDSSHITGGSFVMDMTSLTVDSASVIEPGKNHLDLQNHLKSNEFFWVDNYPTTRFEITTMAPYDSAQAKALLNETTNMVSGNLQLKDSIINITFPAKITISDSIVKVEAKFLFDRTKWGLNYKAEGDPQNWMISKEIELDVILRGYKKE